MWERDQVMMVLTTKLWMYSQQLAEIEWVLQPTKVNFDKT
jgi:hypothetical protein